MRLIRRLWDRLCRWFCRRRLHAHPYRPSDPDLLREQRRLDEIRRRVTILGLDAELARRAPHVER